MHTGGVMVSVLSSSVVDRGFNHRSGQAKDLVIKFVFAASPISTYTALRSKSKDWLPPRVGIKMMWTCGVTCLPTDSCFSELQM